MVNLSFDNPKSRASMLVGVLVLAVVIGAGIYFVETIQAQPRTFGTPTDAVTAFVNAARKHDVRALESLLGSDSRDIVESGDSVADNLALDRFVAAYDMKSNLVANNATSTSLHVGNDDWSLPMPLVMEKGRWHFDADAGRDEILTRRIGRNEANAIQASLAFVDAEREYAMADHDGDGIREYAQRFISTSGKQDGLYWPVKGSEPPSPLGPFFAEASAEAYLTALNPKNVAGGALPSNPFYGYFYRILTSQGPGAPGGAYDYIVDGNMIGGFAMVAYPAEYGNSGVMTFMVNHDGFVYQKDLGPDTDSIAETIEDFNPDNGWQRVRPDTQAQALNAK